MTEENNRFDTKKSRKTYDKATKKKALTLLKKKDAKDVAAKLGISESVLRSWKIKEVSESKETLPSEKKIYFPKPKTNTEELFELKQKLESLQQENMLLKNMVEYLSKEAYLPK